MVILNKSIMLFSFLAVVLVVALAGWADTNGVWHEAEDVRGTVFGADEGYPMYIFNSTVRFETNGVLDMNNNNIERANEVEVSTIKSNRADGNVVVQLG